MPNYQNLGNSNFEANMDLQHGGSDKVVSRSPHSTQIQIQDLSAQNSYKARFDLKDSSNKLFDTENKLIMQVNNI